MLPAGEGQADALKQRRSGGATKWKRSVTPPLVTRRFVTPMVIGVLQFELLIHGPESLKDKRRVVRSVRDRLHRDHMVSVAEVDALDNMTVAVMALAVVGRDGVRVGEILDHVSEKLRALTDAELGATRRDLIHGKSLPEPPADQTRTDERALDAELLAYFDDEDADLRRSGESD